MKKQIDEEKKTMLFPAFQARCATSCLSVSWNAFSEIPDEYLIHNFNLPNLTSSIASVIEQVELKLQPTD